MVIILILKLTGKCLKNVKNKEIDFLLLTPTAVCCPARFGSNDFKPVIFILTA